MELFNSLPKNLPIPKDDGACDHLVGMKMPSIDLLSTNGTDVNFSTLSNTVVIYLYPMTARPDTELPDDWDEIPGARGCTPQSCSFRDHYSELKHLNASVFGLSTQSSEYQKEAVERLHLPFPLVSDESLEFIRNLSLPTMKVEDMILSKRVTLIVFNAVIKKVFYPVFPPNENAEQVLDYLKLHQ